MWNIMETINKLLEERGTLESSPKNTEDIENYTARKIIDVATLRELIDKSSRVRKRLRAIRSYWDDSLVPIIYDHLKSFLVDDVDYQNLFVLDSISDDAFDSYNLIYNIFNKAVRFLEDKKCLVEITESLNFLKGLDTWDSIPLTDEALKRKISG